MVTIPTTAEIRDQIISDIEGKLSITVPALPKAFIRVLATALAGVQSLAYRFGLWIYKQIFAATADEAALILRGAQYGLSRSPAVRAVLTAEATGTNGTQIPAGTLWVGDDNSLVYQQAETAEIAGGTAAIIVECLTAGDDGNLSVDDTMKIGSPIAGIDDTATVTGTTTTGEDQETIESFRAQVMEREKNKPQGGAAPDYVGWALEVPGIVKAFAHRISAGYATVYPMIALTGDRIPDAAKREEVLAYLSDLIRKPLQSTPVVEPMSEIVFDIEIADLAPNTATIKTAIEVALAVYLLTRYPRQYPNEPNATDVVSAAALSGISIDVGAAELTLTMKVGGSPFPSKTLAAGQLAILGTVTWL